MTDAMAHPNERIVREMYAAFGRGDAAAVPSAFDDDVVVHVPGHHPLSGDYHGPVEVFEFFARQRELAEGDMVVEVHDVLANDEHAVALLLVRAQRNNRSLDVAAAHVMHVDGGRISELWIHPTDQDGVDAFWS